MLLVWLLRKCVECKKYTLNEKTCPKRGAKVRIPHPAKFSPEDRYAKYRLAIRDAKKNENHNNKRS